MIIEKSDKGGVSIEGLVYDYEKELAKVADTINVTEFEAVKKRIIHSIIQGKNIFLLGDGINSAIADHFAVDITKNVGIALGNNGLRVQAISMNQPMPLVTALANDVSQDMVYAEMLRLFAVPGDLLMIFSNEFSSESIENARKYAYEHGIKIVSISGEESCKSLTPAHAVLKIKSDNPFIIQDILLFLTHTLTDCLKEEIKYPVVFLDRDGVINVDSPDYIKSIEEFRLIEGVPEAIKLLNLNGYAVVVITNQSIIGRGMVKEKQVEEIHQHMKKELFEKGAVINGIYYCPHAPAEHCTCRKPSPQLIQQAFEEMPLARENAYMIGNSGSDIETGLNAGIRTIFIGEPGELGENLQCQNTYAAGNLFDAVTWIIKNR
ncbi:HAD-IIIA family hydrolase [Anaeromicropila populeti]|uniref:D,D-heptose 1,7-bisphosphate phosphatase n=1 Tax=Anaeromicropila populeti TaxID=37658 RepID=A0A1I6L6M2_9FIRM|nr:HAD-IIIA family hydrolase [Anaeromicropila populeti]SFR99087.1 D-sedoheptulose 7-phosphate isomerase [Anaeromicropila populeti]